MAGYHIYKEHIHSSDPRLKRHVHHDQRSRAYEFDTTGLTLQKVEWVRTLPILNQGQVGSCTAEAGTGVIGTHPYADNATAISAYSAKFGSFDQNGAYRLYSAESVLQGTGPYPPNDVGSSGLACANVLKTSGVIAGYTHVFVLSDAQLAITKQAFITGFRWYNSMYTPDSDGLVVVDLNSGIAGGHELEVVGYDPATDLWKLANSWDTTWGQGGYFYLRGVDYGTLLANQGDITIFTPLSVTTTPTLSTFSCSPTTTTSGGLVVFTATFSGVDWLQVVGTTNKIPVTGLTTFSFNWFPQTTTTLQIIAGTSTTITPPLSATVTIGSTPPIVIWPVTIQVDASGNVKKL